MFLVIAVGIYMLGFFQSKKTENQTVKSTSKTKTEKTSSPTKTESSTNQNTNQPVQNQVNNIVEEEPTEEPAPTEIIVKTYKQGNLDIDPNKSADLDEGIITSSEKADIKFLVDGTNNVRGIAFSVGIKYYDWGTAEISNGKESCKSVQFTSSNPPGGSVVLSDDIKSGENFCYITNEGRYGTFKVLQLIKQAGKVRIYFTTWE